MTTYYVRSTDGSNSDSGLTWALAKATLGGALAVAAAGDRIWVSQAHSESSGTLPLTAIPVTDNPLEILCGNDSAEPPTSLATGASITSTTGDIQIGGPVYVYGITFVSGQGSASACNIFLGSAGSTSGINVYENCTFVLASTGDFGQINFNNNGAASMQTVFLNCIVKFGKSNQNLACAAGLFKWIGGSVDPSGTIPATLFRTALQMGDVTIQGVDLSALVSSTILDFFSVGKFATLIMTDCKLASNTTISAGTRKLPGNRVIVDRCGSAGSGYSMVRSEYLGDVTVETTLVRTGGASDGATPISHKMVSGDGTKFWNPLYGPEIFLFNAVLGISKTVTIEILHDSVTALKDDEVWIEVEALTSSSNPLGSFVVDRKTDILASGSNQDTSTAVWASGLGNPNTQKLVVTLTPQLRGVLRCRVALAKPSYTIYACPKVVLT